MDACIDTHMLKPHHIILLSNYIMKGDGGEHYIRDTINDFEHYPQYEEIYRRDLERDGVPIKYDQGFVDRLVRYCRELSSDPNAEITVVDGPDSFCSLGCNRRNGSCATSSEVSKRKLMQAYGIGIGYVFTVSDISG